MPAIGNYLDNLVKVNVSCECNENHGYDFETKIEKDAQEYNLINEPMVIMHQQGTGSRVISFMLLCILAIWFALAFWLIISPPTGSSRSLCSDLLYDPSLNTGTKEEILQKLHQQLGQFNKLSTLFGQYYDVTYDKINKATQDPYLWYIFFSIMIDHDRGINESATSLKKLAKTRFDDQEAIRAASTKIDSHKLNRIFQSMGVRKNSDSDEIGGYNIWKYLSNTKYDANKSRNNTKLEKGIKRANDTPNVRFNVNKNYLLYDRIQYGDKFTEISNSSQITLTIQTSINRLNSFILSASRWNGPISLAIFLNEPSEYYMFKSYLAYMKRCHRDIYDRTCFSIASPINNPIPHDGSILTNNFDSTLCSSAETKINDKLKKNTIDSKQRLQSNIYPENTMRNVAIHNVLTPYHLTIDIDIIPCPKMSESLNKFLKYKFYRNPLLIITYEVSKTAKFPANKAELVSLNRKRLAQPLHKDAFTFNQNTTIFSKWEKIHDTYNDVHIIPGAVKFRQHDEPIFIAHATSPPYNESILGFGSTRISHAYEMYLKNSNFNLLSPIFTVHLGLQNPNSSSQHYRMEQFATSVNTPRKYQVFEFFIGKA